MRLIDIHIVEKLPGVNTRQDASWNLANDTLSSALRNLQVFYNMNESASEETWPYANRRSRARRDNAKRATDIDLF